MHWQVALLQLPQSPAASSVVPRASPASGTLFPERHFRGAVRTLMLATVLMRAPFFCLTYLAGFNSSQALIQRHHRDPHLQDANPSPRCFASVVRAGEIVDALRFYHDAGGLELGDRGWN
jgi:hypothetical protein